MSENKQNPIVKALGKMNPLKQLLLGAVAVLLVAALLFLGFRSVTSTKNKSTKLGFEDIGLLATQAAYCTEIGVIDSARGESLGIRIPFTQSKYIYSYDVKVLAGLNFSEIEYTVDDEQETIEVLLPPIEIISDELVLDSFEIYHEEESIFNRIQLETQNEHMAQMERDAVNSAVENGLFENARSNAEVLLKGFFTNHDGWSEYTIRFTSADKEF